MDGLPRRRKSALERRQQQHRSDARAVARLLGGLSDLAVHRGSALSILFLTMYPFLNVYCVAAILKLWVQIALKYLRLLPVSLEMRRRSSLCRCSLWR